jgi:hypothetical protein
MANYLCEAHGLLDDAFPWSFRLYMSSADSEATVESTWHGSVKAMWDNAALNAIIPATTHFTGTSSSTLDGTYHQTTKTSTDEDLVGTGGAALPFRAATLLTWRTAFSNKSGRGRSYFPGLDVTSLAADGYYYSSTTTGKVKTAAEVMTADWAGILTPLLLHRESLTTYNIISGDVPDAVATQRRRADKRVPTRTTFTV